jgi:hypothetical protein
MGTGIMRESYRNTLDETPLSSQKQRTRFTVGSIELAGISEPDFHALFRHLPGIFVATRPDFTIVAVSDDLLRTTLTWREDITGRSFFDVFPDNPLDNQGGAQKLKSALRDVMTTRMMRSMRVLRYDIPDRLSGDGTWIEKFWTAVSRPVVDRETGDVLCVLTEARDVTRTVHLALWLDTTDQLGPDLQRYVQHLRRDVNGEARHIARVRQRITREMALTGATPDTLVNELRALLHSPENRLYACAGEWVSETGVYVAYHRDGCTFAPRVRYFAEGVQFPGCERCGNDVLYRMSHALSR